MKTNLDSFKTDSDIEKDGIWFKINDETGFLISRFGGYNSPKVKAAMAKYFKPYAYQIQQDTLDVEKEKEIMVRVFVESCMLDWKGIEVDGKPAAFDKDLAVKILTPVPDLFNALREYASDYKNYREDLGNF